MPKAIKDEFSELPISRQRKYQMRMNREKRCQICGEPIVMGRGVWCIWSSKGNIKEKS
jgi:hypothetical protein